MAEAAYFQNPLNRTKTNERMLFVAQCDGGILTFCANSRNNNKAGKKERPRSLTSSKKQPLLRTCPNVFRLWVKRVGGHGQDEV